MKDIYILIIIGLALLAILTFFYFLLRNRTQKIEEGLLDSQENIMMLYQSKSIKFINKSGLSFLGHDSLDSFLSVHSDISDVFIEENGYTNKHSYGQNWVASIYKDKHIKENRVKIKTFSHENGLYYSFYIKISKMLHSNKYILSFCDITTLEHEKETYKSSSELDPLTKAYNRVKLNKMFETIFFNAKKYNQPLTMILFDIDYFKIINDTYGHNVGDKVLQEIAGLTRTLLHDGDVFARWGGEEFIIILENISLDQTTKFALRLRAEIERYSFDIAKNVTCSFGVTQFTQGDQQIDFFERVDKALYEAKENGRNQVVTK